MVGRVCTVGLYVVAAFLSLALESAQDAFEVLISIGAGTGLLYLLRWFWWRINAWSRNRGDDQLVRGLGRVLRDGKTGNALPFAHTVLYLGGVHHDLLADRRRTSRRRPAASGLIAFYEGASRPVPAGAASARSRRSAKPRPRAHSDHMGKATLGWISGCLTIWSSLFAIGNFLYGRYQLALILTVVFVVSGAVLRSGVVNTLWRQDRGA